MASHAGRRRSLFEELRATALGKTVLTLAALEAVIIVAGAIAAQFLRLSTSRPRSTTLSPVNISPGPL